MIERFVMNKAMHMGPINRDLRPGDVVAFDTDLDTMAINGNDLHNDGRKAGSTEGFAEVARILKKQAQQNPDNPFADILKPKETDGVSGYVGTDTLTIFPILGCFKAVEDWLNGEQKWTPVTDLQAHFLEHFIEYIEQVDALDGNLERRASNIVEEINGWLKERGFDIQLDKLPGRRDFYVASILDVLVKWLKKGDKEVLNTSKGQFDAVRLKEGVAAFQNLELHGFPVVKIRTQSDDVVCMSICERLPEDKFAIFWKVQQLQRIQKPYDCEGVIFPMVKYDQQVDISFLKGLRTSDNPEEYWEVAEALQQTKFRMNEVGARAESAAAMSMRFCCAAIAHKPWVIINKPFILWFERNGIAMPLFSGTFAEDVWENPGSLD